MAYAVQLRIFSDDRSGPHGAGPHGVGDPRSWWTLGQFFDEWFLPGMLAKKRAAGTIHRYGDALKYWSDVTGDPPLAEIDDQVCIDFVGLLPEWGFSRRGQRRGEPLRIARLTDCPAFTPLQSATMAGHVQRIGTLLERAGPRYSTRIRVAEILPRLPYLPQVTAEFETKPPFTLATARLICAAAARMGRPELPAGFPRLLWWRTRLALFYFTGLRAGTVTRLAWSHVRPGLDGSELWLDVPKQIVKTGKPIRMPLHPQLAELLGQLPRGGDLILPEGCGYRHFLTLHSELQELAGIPEADRQSPHAWRRTHLSLMGELGASQALEVARIAADHSSGRTTMEHYVGQTLVNGIRLRLPPLFA